MSVHSNTNLIGLGETAKLPPPFFVLPMDSLGGFAPPPLGIPRSVFHGLDFEPYMKNVALLFGHFTLIIRFAGAERDYLSNLGIVPLPISST